MLTVREEKKKEKRREGKRWLAKRRKAGGSLDDSIRKDLGESTATMRGLQNETPCCQIAAVSQLRGYCTRPRFAFFFISFGPGYLHK